MSQITRFCQDKSIFAVVVPAPVSDPSGDRPAARINGDEMNSDLQVDSNQR
jgi:hypothetical protein